MGDDAVAALYCEDDAHEQFVRPLIGRLARDVGVSLGIETMSGRGGHGAAISEFEAWQARARLRKETGIPDLLVVVIDTNCRRWGEARQAVADRVDASLFPRVVVACPDPHIERWFMADPPTFREVVGGPPKPDPGKCERNLYEQLLRASIEDAGETILTDAAEFGPEIVGAMDLYRAGKRLKALGHFIGEVRSALGDLRASPTPFAE